MFTSFFSSLLPIVDALWWDIVNRRENWRFIVKCLVSPVKLHVHDMFRMFYSHANNYLLCYRTIVALVYNVLKTLMEMNCTLFDELTSSYKSDRQR